MTNRIKRKAKRKHLEIGFYKHGHHFVFVVPKGHEEKFCRAANKMAGDDSSKFSWYDASVFRAKLLEIQQ